MRRSVSSRDGCVINEGISSWEGGGVKVERRENGGENFIKGIIVFSLNRGGGEAGFKSRK